MLRTLNGLQIHGAGDEQNSIGSGELEQNRESYRAERCELDGWVIVVPEVIKTETEGCHAE